MKIQLDPGNTSINFEIEQDLDKLGIEAEIVIGTDDVGKTYILFKNEDDMNLYKMAGKWNNFWWLECVVLEAA